MQNPSTSAKFSDHHRLIVIIERISFSHRNKRTRKTYVSHKTASSSRPSCSPSWLVFQWRARGDAGAGSWGAARSSLRHCRRFRHWPPARESAPDGRPLPPPPRSVTLRNHSDLLRSHWLPRGSRSWFRWGSLRSTRTRAGSETTDSFPFQFWRRCRSGRFRNYFLLYFIYFSRDYTELNMNAHGSRWLRDRYTANKQFQLKTYRFADCR